LFASVPKQKAAFSLQPRRYAMTSIQTQIMKLVDAFARKFESCLPAGDDAIIFKRGDSSVTVRFIPQIQFYQVISRGPSGPTKNKIGVREHEIGGFFTATEMAHASL